MSELISRTEHLRDLSVVRKMAEMAYYAYQSHTLACKAKVDALLATGMPDWHPEVVDADNARLKSREMEFIALDFIAEINERYDLLLRESVDELSANPDELGQALTQLQLHAIPLPIEDLIKGGKSLAV